MMTVSTTRPAIAPTRARVAGGVPSVAFGLLGSLEARRLPPRELEPPGLRPRDPRAAGEPLDLGGPRERKVLAVLLLEPGRVVPLDRLVDELWADGPPATAAKQVRNAVSRLRALLDADLVQTEPAGYRLAISAADTDAGQFRDRAARAARAVAAGQPAVAAGLLRTALDLWRGPFLAGLSGPAIETAAAGWDEQRCAAQEQLHDCLLALGQHRAILGDLLATAARHPLREKPVAQLMLALYRSGRQAEALACYTSTRERLADELGLDPGPGLRRLHGQILAADPALAAPVPAATGPAATGPAATGPAATGPAATGPAATGPAATGPAATGTAGIGAALAAVLAGRRLPRACAAGGRGAVSRRRCGPSRRAPGPSS